MNAGSNWLLISLDCIPNVSKRLHWNEADCLLNKVEGFDKWILLLYCTTMFMDATCYAIAYNHIYMKADCIAKWLEKW